MVLALMVLVALVLVLWYIVWGCCGTGTGAMVHCVGVLWYWYWCYGTLCGGAVVLALVILVVLVLVLWYIVWGCCGTGTGGMVHCVGVLWYWYWCYGTLCGGAVVLVAEFISTGS